MTKNKLFLAIVGCLACFLLVACGNTGSKALVGDWVRADNLDNGEGLVIRDGKIKWADGYTVDFEVVSDDTIKVSKNGKEGTEKYELTKDKDTLYYKNRTFYRKGSDILKQMIAEEE